MVTKVISKTGSGPTRTVLGSLLLPVLFSFIGPNTGGAASQTRRPDPAKFQQLLLKVFGDAVRLDPQMRKTALAGKPGERHYVDNDGDGTPEEVWFIDDDSRHPERYRPLLVKVVDQAGDLKMGGEPNRYNSLYVADWNADGYVDAVIEYKDIDGDRGMDEMAMYLPSYDPARGMMAYWSRDVGDDHLLWFDVAYTYVQSLAQWRTHFGGDEQFCMFYLDETSWVWVPTLEDPFCFYDHDRDGVSEEAIRVVMAGTVRSVRHSFDADNGGTPARPRSYDVSLTALAPPDLVVPARYSEQVQLRGIASQPFLKYELAPSYLAPITWKKMQLTWVENSHNIAATERYPDDHVERWEGVINHGSIFFPKVGGPSCGPFNIRFEVVSKPTAPARLYYHPTDHRLHIYHANHAWMEVDADMDYKPEMRYDLVDADGDGVIDTWKLDLGVGGTDTWHSTQLNGVIPVQWNWHDVNASWEPVVREMPPKLFALNQRLEAAIRSLDPNAPEDPIFKLMRASFSSPAIPAAVARKFIGADATLRFYLDVIKDRLICDLKRRFRERAFWQNFDEARSSGDCDSMRSILEQRFGLESETEEYSAWTAKHRAILEPPRVGWAKFGPSIGWESEKVAYRCYGGQVDFFGKRGDRLIYGDMRGVRNPGAKWALAEGNYHDEREWGMDALEIGNSSGAGGITLYLDGRPIPVRSTGKKGPILFESRLLSEESDRVMVEMRATQVGGAESNYTIRFRFSALAGHQHSAVEILVEGGNPDDKLELGIGLTKLAQEAFLVDTEAGVMGTWGIQSPRIGTIGMGVIFPSGRFLRFADMPNERQVIVKVEREVPLTYHIQCDWLRGRAFPVAPVARDWLEELRRTAASVRRDASVSGTVTTRSR